MHMLLPLLVRTSLMLIIHLANMQHLYMHIHTHTYIYIYIYIYLFMYNYVHIHISIHIHTCNLFPIHSIEH